MTKKLVYFSLGSNLGDKETNIREAIKLMEERIGTLVRQSALYATKPWGFESENQFLNAAISMETELPAVEVLQLTKAIERELGRTQKSVPTGDGSLPEYHDRTIDIDILLYGDEHISTPELTVPHPHMQERDFVMIPLKEILTYEHND